MTDPEIFEFIVSEEDLEFKRVDQLLVKKLPQLSRNLIKKLFDKRCISIDGEIKELKKSPKLGQKIIVELPEAEPTDIKAQNIPLNILFEDEHLIIIDKQAGLVIHPAAGNPDGTLVNAILFHCPDIKGIGHEKRPGIVHRLDKGTTGVMVVAKENKTHEHLVNMFSKHELERKYEAILVGTKMNPAGKIETLFGRHPKNRLKMTSTVSQGKTATTEYKVLSQFDCLTHMEFTLHTGRTHQIRVHACEQLKAALLCDPLYGNPKQQIKRIPSFLRPIVNDYEFPLLHAKHLAFEHPMTKEKLSFTTTRPDPFNIFLEKMLGENS